MRNCKWYVQARVECPLYVFKGLTGFDTDKPNGVFLKRILAPLNKIPETEALLRYYFTCLLSSLKVKIDYRKS